MQFGKVKNPEELYKFMKDNIHYGFVSKYDKSSYIKNKLNDVLYNKLLMESYYLQTPQQLLKSKCGICFDQVEFIRYWLISQGYKVYTFWSKVSNHVFLIYEDKGYFYLFERTFRQINGIHKFDTLEDAKDFYCKEEESFMLLTNKPVILEYEDVDFGCDYLDFSCKILDDNGISLSLLKKI